MRLDIRFPIGLMFSTFGIILTLFGIFSDRAIYALSLGTNINLVWGLVLIAFGGVMLVLGWRGAHAGHEEVGTNGSSRKSAADAHH